MITTTSVFYYAHTDLVTIITDDRAQEARVSLFEVLCLSWFVNAVVLIEELLTHSVGMGWGWGLLRKRDHKKRTSVRAETDFQ